MNKKRLKKYLTGGQECGPGKTYVPSLDDCIEDDLAEQVLSKDKYMEEYTGQDSEDINTIAPQIPSVDSSLEGFDPELIGGVPVNTENPTTVEEDLSQINRPEEDVFTQTPPELNSKGEINSPYTTNIETEGIQKTELVDSTSNENKKYKDLILPSYTYDIPSAATYTGKSIEEGNTAGILAGGFKTIAAVGRNLVTGMGEANRRKQVEDKARQKQSDKSAGINNVKYYEKGGEVELAEKLTGEVITEEEGTQPNAELEDGEYTQKNDGNVQQVKGDKHEQGGVELEMKNGEKILSDHLKVGKGLSKDLRKDLDIKIKHNDTYAAVLDKATKKLGIEKLNKEQEKIIKKLEGLDSEDGSTNDINSKFLKEKISEIEQKKEPLKQQRKVLFELLFQHQEKSKPKEDKKVFEDGGTYEAVKKLAEQYGIDPEEAINIAEEEYRKGGTIKRKDEGHRLPTYQDAGSFLEKIKNSYIDSGVDPELMGSSGALEKIPENQKKKILEDAGITVYGGVKASDILETVSNNPWYNWSDFDGTEESVKSFQKEYNSRVKSGAKLKVDGKFGEQTQSAYIPWLKNPEKETEEKITESEEKTTETEESGLITFADQFRMPPSGVQPHAMVDRTFDRIDPEQFSDIPYFEQVNKRTDSQVRAIKDLPPAQRTAALMQLQDSQTQGAAKVLADTQKGNIALRSKADQFNAQTQRMEENARAQDLLSFEQRQLTALGNTEDDFRRYFQALGQDQLMKAQQAEQIRLLNDKFSDVAYTGDGRTEQTSYPELKSKFNQLKQKVDEMEKGSNKTVARKGGRFKKYKK